MVDTHGSSIDTRGENATHGIRWHGAAPPLITQCSTSCSLSRGCVVGCWCDVGVLGPYDGKRLARCSTCETHYDAIASSFCCLGEAGRCSASLVALRAVHHSVAVPPPLQLYPNVTSAYTHSATRRYNDAKPAILSQAVLACGPPFAYGGRHDTFSGGVVG